MTPWCPHVIFQISIPGQQFFTSHSLCCKDNRGNSCLPGCLSPGRTLKDTGGPGASWTQEKKAARSRQRHLCGPRPGAGGSERVASNMYAERLERSAPPGAWYRAPLGSTGQWGAMEPTMTERGSQICLPKVSLTHRRGQQRVFGRSWGQVRRCLQCWGARCLAASQNSALGWGRSGGEERPARGKPRLASLSRPLRVSAPRCRHPSGLVGSHTPGPSLLWAEPCRSFQ